MRLGYTINGEEVQTLATAAKKECIYLTEQRLTGLVREGRIPAFRVGRRWFVRPGVLTKVLKP